MRTYLDNAATSWPKPEPVYAAIDRYQREVGAPAGRGAYAHAIEAQRTVDDARRALAALINASDPNRIVFGANGTDVLNLAIHGVLRQGDHAVTTVCEHNSVLRPLADAHRRLGVEVTHVRCDAAGYVDPADVRAALRPNTRLVAVTHASNVTGAVQPVADIARIAREAGALSLVDAAQSAGHLPLDVATIDADLVAASGHKGLLGPLGTALLYIRPGAERRLAPTRQGGTGLHSTSDAQPDELPHRHEAGNLNVPALAGLAAAAKFLADETVAKIATHEADLVARFLAGLRELPAVRLYGPAADQPRAPVVSFAVEDFDPQDFAAALDSSFGVQCRAGLHCAPRMHEALSTLATGGLVRLSVGWSTTHEDVARTLQAIAALAGATFD
jgi:cysteine desulfurase / selenocysteine lyase